MISFCRLLHCRRRYSLMRCQTVIGQWALVSFSKMPHCRGVVGNGSLSALPYCHTVDERWTWYPFVGCYIVARRNGHWYGSVHYQTTMGHCGTPQHIAKLHRDSRKAWACPWNCSPCTLSNWGHGRAMYDGGRQPALTALRASPALALLCNVEMVSFSSLPECMGG